MALTWGNLIQLLLLAFIVCSAGFVFMFGDKKTRRAFIPVAIIGAGLVLVAAWKVYHA